MFETLLKWWIAIVAVEKIIGTIVGLIFFAIILFVVVAQWREKVKP